MWLIGGVLAVAQASAQTPALSTEAASPYIETGGRSYTESIQVSAMRFSQALKYGAVKKGSESVDLGGRTLARGQDYEIDYPSGTIYLKVQPQPGQVLRVSYRYDEATGGSGVFGTTGAATQAGFNGFKIDFSPQTSAILGLGLTERLGDGTVISSNVYGLGNSFSFGSSSLKGVMMLGDRQKNSSTDLMTGGSTGKDIEGGQGRALIQNLSSKFMGGSVTAYYQDIDSRFGGFQALGASGYTAAQITQLSKEAGLKRTAFAFDKVGMGDLKVSNGFQTVGDAQGSIVQKTAAATLGGFSLSWWNQKIDQGFTRFQDTGAANWQQLAKEKDLDREGLALGWKGSKGTAFNFSSLKLDSLTGGIAKSSIGAELPRIKLSYGEQRVDQGFNRFGDLRGDEFNAGQVAQEGGLLRRTTAVEYTPGKNQKVTASQAVIKDSKDEFSSIDLAASLGRLQFSHSQRSVGEGFTRLGSIGAQDTASAMSAMLNMTKAGLTPQGGDPSGFYASAGLDRSNYRLSYDFGKGVKANLDQLKIQGRSDALKAAAVGLETKNATFKLRTQDTGENFSEAASLMASEQAVLGAAAGFKKQDMEASFKLGGSKKLDLSELKASDQTGGLDRTNLAFSDKGFSLSMVKRDVDTAMPSLNSLADPERDLFKTLAGFNTEQSSLRWTSIKGLTVEADRNRWDQKDGGLNRDQDRALFRWSPDSKTSFEALLTSHKYGDTADSQIDQKGEVFTLARTIDGLGKITLSQNYQKYDGSTDTNPDSLTRQVVMETKLAKNLGLRSEQSETKYENGDKETKTSNTLSTELSRRAGVSVTETLVKRDDKDDQLERNYGVWYDFGRGIRLNYGYIRQMDGSTGSLNSNVAVTPGTIQDVKVDAASYQEVRQDDQRDQHTGRVSLSNAKPLRFGWLSDVKFYYNSDTYRDQWAWQRENKTFGMSGAWGRVAWGYDYNSQIAPGGDRAIDRFFSLKTDKSGKEPFQASIRYGVRTLPSDQEVMIRDYSVVWKPLDRVTFNHAVVTNPLANQNGVLLGTVAQPLRTNNWSLNYSQTKDFKAGLFWKENVDENRLLRSREGGVDLLFWAAHPSPLHFTYGLQQTDQNGRMTAHKFSFSFTQKPGPNQSWSLLLENLNWEHGRPEGTSLQNWNLRMDYSWRF